MAVQLTLPNGIERTESVRSGPSGSVTGTLEGEWQCSSHCHSAVNVWWWNVQARVAVRSVRSGPSGSVTGTLEGEWQCSSHCHSAVNVWWWNVQARVAVSPTRGRTLKGQWQCRSGRPPGQRALRPLPGCAPRGVIPSLTRNGPSANSGAF